MSDTGIFRYLSKITPESMLNMFKGRKNKLENI